MAGRILPAYWPAEDAIDLILHTNAKNLLTLWYYMGKEDRILQTNGGFLISQIKQMGSRVFEKILARAHIDAFNGAQGRILFILWQADHVPIIELSRKTGLAKTTLTGMLQRMEASGLVKRTQREADRRQVLIYLTEKARDLHAEYDNVSLQMNDIYYRGFREEEIILFEQYLTRIRTNLEGELSNE